jgi:Protein of unknown function, DUF481
MKTEVVGGRLASRMLLPLILASLATVGSAAEPASPAPSMDSIPAAADVIRMKNGSLLLGKLSGATLGVLSFEIVDVGETEVKMKDVAQIRASNADFQVDSEGRKRLVGRIRPDVTAGSLVVVSATGDVVIPFSQIIRLKRVDQTLLEKLDGYVGIGYSFTSASDVTRWSLTEFSTYATANWRLFQHLSVINTETPVKSGTDRIDAGLGGFYAFDGTWIAMQYFQYQKIPSIGVDDRWVSITGGGKRIVHSRVLDLSLLSGITFQKEHGINGAEGGWQSELPVVLDFAFGMPTARLDFAGQAIYYHSLSESGRHRYDARLNLNYEMIKNFKIGLQFLYNFDSEPLDPTSERTDRSTSLTVGYTF